MRLGTVTRMLFAALLALAALLSDGGHSAAGRRPSDAASSSIRALTAASLDGLPPITVPHLTGIFVSLDNITSARSRSGWTKDLTAMRAIGLEWFAIRATAAGGENGGSADCPLGDFSVFFPPGQQQQPPCFHPEHPGVDTVGTILEVAQHVGLKVHLGLGFPKYSRIPVGMNSTTYYRTLAGINWELAQRLWALYGEKYGPILRGWYTDVEESNSRGELALMADLVGHYLEPLAGDLHRMTAKQAVPTTVWASPYYVGNKTRHPTVDDMTPQVNWLCVAPHLPSTGALTWRVWVVLRGLVGANIRVVTAPRPDCATGFDGGSG